MYTEQTAAFLTTFLQYYEKNRDMLFLHWMPPKVLSPFLTIHASIFRVLAMQKGGICSIASRYPFFFNIRLFNIIL